jgi:antitoxin component of MazEF toxin-antitoxin module
LVNTPALDLVEDSEAKLAISDGKILTSPKRHAYPLDELLAAVTEENCHGETSTGQTVGAELV